ncbi:nitroreductase family protein [bacterium]|nr:MAG: nitroreductase family protein [bacterium]
MADFPHIPFTLRDFDAQSRLERGEQFRDWLDQRRSVRFFSDEPVDRRCIELAIETASTAPSGAHQQPWTFVAVSDPAIKREIRIGAEKEEQEFYEGGRATDEWLKALGPIGTDSHKPFLETVPWIVVVFEQTYSSDDEGERVRHYYTKESVGIACGLFIAALHEMGLATLTHTPSPMGFLREILHRPSSERPFIMFPIGRPTSDCTVPDLRRRSLDEVSVFFDHDPSPAGDHS